jgi:hypothetical protein
MKTKIHSFLILLLLLPGSLMLAQDIQIVSNTDWEVGTAQEGPFNGELFDVSFCVDESVIDSACGTSYGSPLLEEHFDGCGGMTAIWGAASPSSCNFPAATYWFRYNFNLSDFDCINVESANARIQADNSFDFYLNGTQIGGSNVTDWYVLFEYGVLPHLQEGDNEILIRVENLGGGTCFNYAFLAFCLDIDVNEECGALETIALNPVTISNETCVRDLATEMLPCASEYAWTVEYTDLSDQATLDTITTSNTLTLKNLNNGQPYTVNVKVQGLCEFSETDMVESELQVAWDNEACTLVSTQPEVTQFFEFDIFPNPAASIVYLNFDQVVELSYLSVLDSSGKVIYSTSPKQSSTQYSIDLRHWPSGVYFVQGHVNGVNIRKRLVKVN